VSRDIFLNGTMGTKGAKYVFCSFSVVLMCSLQICLNRVLGDNMQNMTRDFTFQLLSPKTRMIAQLLGQIFKEHVKATLKLHNISYHKNTTKILSSTKYVIWHKIVSFAYM